MVALSIVIRVDSSSSIGSGHVARCVTLAKHLRAQGCSVRFVCRDHPGNLSDKITSEGFPVSLLPAPPADLSQLQGYVRWLGVPVRSDVQDTKKAITEACSSPPDWLIVDHYALDAEWETSLRPFVLRIMAIDDLADRVHDCDVLLDQNLVAEFETRYDGKAPSHARLLLGPSFALLQPEYAELRTTAAKRIGPVRRILIYCGEVDTPNVSGKALAAVLALGRNNVSVDLVLGRGNPHRRELMTFAAVYQGITVHSDLASLAPLMVEADLAIGAGGATNWERICLRLPSIIVTIADNQRAAAEELNRLGLVVWLGDAADVDSTAIRSALDGPPMHFWSQDWDDVVDGLGALRVAAALTLTPASRFLARAATAGDESLLLGWANDPGVRANAFNASRITPAGHHRWFAERLASPGVFKLFIVQTETGIPVGQVRFEFQRSAWLTDYSVASMFRGLGLGRVVLLEGLRCLARETSRATVVAEVLHHNERSKRVFVALGFVLDAAADGVERYTLTINGP